ncbi:MAG: hypothetical protein ACKOBM_05330 [Gammaproteobacteria bacterium]
MPKFLLIGLCEPPTPEDQAAFDEWFVDQHIEDTAKCPNFVRGSVYKLAGAHLGSETASGYLSVYEVEAPSYEDAEAVLNAWQRDPNAWAGRQRHLDTAARLGGMPLRVRGSGWYEFLKSFDGPAKLGPS